MALGDVNVQNATLDANGDFALSTGGDAPTGSGIYTVSKFGSFGAGTQTIRNITGASGYAVITLKAAVAGDITLVDGVQGSTTYKLREGLAWLPQSTDDRITLRDAAGNSTVWIEEIPRGVF